MSLVVKQIYDDPDELDTIFNYLNNIEIEYHKEYKGMYGRMMKVPRGQASFTENENIHYDYKVSGGSPPNYIMCEKLKEIVKRSVKRGRGRMVMGGDSDTSELALIPLDEISMVM